jgi:hypothetical protein
MLRAELQARDQIDLVYEWSCAATVNGDSNPKTPSRSRLGARITASTF